MSTTTPPKDSAMFVAVANALSGAVGGMIAMTIVQPLDVIRCELQSKATIDQQQQNEEEEEKYELDQEEEIIDDDELNMMKQKKQKETTIGDVIKEIYSNEGINGFYRALSSQLFTLFLSDIIYFFVVTFIKQILYGKREVDAISNLKASTIAGLVNVILTSPFWRANTQIILQRKKKETQNGDDNNNNNDDEFNGLFDAMYKIYINDGMNGLYKGIGPSLWLVSNPIIQFVSYEQFVNILKQYKNTKQLSSLLYFLCGAAGKTVATLCTYPLQVMQTQLRKKNSPFIDMNDCLKKFIIPNLQNGQIKLLFSGLMAKLYQTVTNASIKFMIYEKVLVIITALLRWIQKTIIAAIFAKFVSNVNNTKTAVIKRK